MRAFWRRNYPNDLVGRFTAACARRKCWADWKSSEAAALAALECKCENLIK